MNLLKCRQASVWKRRDGCGTGWNTLAFALAIQLFRILSGLP